MTSPTPCPHLRFPFPAPSGAPLSLGDDWEQVRQAGDLVQVTLPGGQVAWLTTTHAAALAAFRHPDLTRGDADGIPPFPMLGPLILARDGDEHRRIRRLVAGEFTPTRLARYRPRIAQLADELLDAMVATGGPVDLTEAYGFALPLTIIGEMLGVPDAERAQFHAWSDGLLVGAEHAEEAWPSVMAMIDYTKGLIAQRRREPADDLATALATALGAADTGVTDDDAALLAVGIIVGGWETTAAAIATGTYRLLTTTHEGRSTYRWLVDHPEAAPGVVEELLRLLPSTYNATALPRRAAVDIQLGDVTIKAGELIIPGHDIANRDPAVFPDPYQFDPERPNARDHLTFGQGAHVCLGAHLGRLELQIMVAALTSRLPCLRLACDPEEISWDTSVLIRRPREMPVTWDDYE
ncbi:cytochrome P450 [Actinomadura sp. 3N508]|uniref:cytochrome P450 n=1 Tax=Actinomadura sp. 3N508 TaxID=3375153 RepID=UPI003794EE46